MGKVKGVDKLVSMIDYDGHSTEASEKISRLNVIDHIGENVHLMRL